MTVILGAMPDEVAALTAAVENGQFAGFPVHVAVTGVGKVMAAMTTQRLIDTLAPDAVIMVGVAGGLNHALSIGDVVVAADTVQHDLDATALGIPRGTVPFTSCRFLQADRRLLQAAAAIRIEGHNHAGDPVRVHTGRIATGDQFMSRSAQQECRYLTDELDGDAVDMESAAVAQVCISNGVPHLVIRVISDTADGSAKIDFARFLPTAGDRIRTAVQQLLRAIAD